MSKAIDDIAAERYRQISHEGWTPGHDDTHTDRELAAAAGCYVRHYAQRGWMLEAELAHDLWIKPADGRENYQNDELPDEWPADWDEDAWKPKDPRRDLVRAAALIVAEIERLDRLSETREDEV